MSLLPLRLGGTLLPLGAMVPPTPVPVYKRRSFEFDNAGSRFSAIERGPSGDWQSGDSGRLSEASSDLDVDSPGMSPLRGRRLFTRGERIRAHAQSVLIGMLICFSIWAWQPVALWAWARAGGAWAAPTSPRRAHHDIVDEGECRSPHTTAAPSPRHPRHGTHTQARLLAQRCRTSTCSMSPAAPVRTWPSRSRRTSATCATRPAPSPRTMSPR